MFICFDLVILGERERVIIMQDDRCVFVCVLNYFCCLVSFEKTDIFNAEGQSKGGRETKNGEQCVFNTRIQEMVRLRLNIL